MMIAVLGSLLLTTIILGIPVLFVVSIFFMWWDGVCAVLLGLIVCIEVGWLWVIIYDDFLTNIGINGTGSS